MVRDTPIEDAVPPRALPVLLPRAKLGSRSVSGRVDGGDVDLVARMLEVAGLRSGTEARCVKW